MFRLIPILLVLLWPVIHVVLSGKFTGDEKLRWIALTLLFSWLAYPFFLYKLHKQNGNN